MRSLTALGFGASLSPVADIARRRADRLGRTSAAALKAWRNEARALLHLGRADEAVWLLAKVRAGEAATGRDEAGRTERYLAQALAANGNPRDRADAVTVARQAVELCRGRGEQGQREADAAQALLDRLEQDG